jgi:hypothetical protein
MARASSSAASSPCIFQFPAISGRGVVKRRSSKPPLASWAAGPA